MRSFIGYITEAAKLADTTKVLKHIDHAEDFLRFGEEGFNHVHRSLSLLHGAMRGQRNEASYGLTTKYDGSPSVTFGYHPDTHRFFVSTKSLFNKDAKVNYTDADIERNHGHAPGLVKKLKTALQHLPKIAPHHKIMQGDMMYTNTRADKDVTSDRSHHHFTPNTITYSVDRHSPEGRKIDKAKVGVALHTAYTGSISDPKVEYNTDTGDIDSHPDVHVIDHRLDLSKVHYTPEAQKKFTEHMQAAAALHKDHDFSHLDSADAGHLSTYTNKMSDAGERMSFAGLRNHAEAKMQQHAEGLKSTKGVERARASMSEKLAHMDSHAKDWDRYFDMHQHLKQAKHALMGPLNAADYDFRHTINGQHTNPEGHVLVINNTPLKMVDRPEFARKNRERVREDYDPDVHQWGTPAGTVWALKLTPGQYSVKPVSNIVVDVQNTVNNRYAKK